jgi:hypothetical protein
VCVAAKLSEYTKLSCRLACLLHVMGRRRAQQTYRAGKTGWTLPTTSMPDGVQSDGYTGWSSGVSGGLAVKRIVALCVLLSFSPTYIPTLVPGVSFVLSLLDIYLQYLAAVCGICWEMRHTQATLAYLDERVGSDVRLVRTETTSCLASVAHVGLGLIGSRCLLNTIMRRCAGCLGGRPRREPNARATCLV